MNRDEALKKSDDALEELAQALQQGKSEKLLEYLGMLSRFHHYSFCNLILIFTQFPNATQVAGYGKWRELNRFVRKGEKGISILAPLIRNRFKKDSTADSSSQVPVMPEPVMDSDKQAASNPKVLYGFRVVHVFDVSQTEGQDLPEFASLDGDPGETIAHLESVIRNRGIELIFSNELPAGANGMSQGGKITISDSLPTPQRFSTMVHELAHEMLHWHDRDNRPPKAIVETEAEAVAYVVCRAVGLDCSTRASDYIQLWQGDSKILLRSLEKIRSVSSTILMELDTLAQANQEVADVA
jgi:hypothetical protein